MFMLAHNLWLLTYPQHRLGADLKRNVSIIRLGSRELVIHSTAPFTTEDLTAIQSVGRPGWLVEAMMHHDTFAREGRRAFPNIPYLAPAGFSGTAGFPTVPLLPPPPAWNGELEVLEIQGMRSYHEHVFFHRPSLTLIVADLLFNFGPDEPLWTDLFLKAAVTGDHHPGMSRPFKLAIHDPVAFKASMAKMLAWDFDRIIVGHGDVIESHGKQILIQILHDAGF